MPLISIVVWIDAGVSNFNSKKLEDDIPLAAVFCRSNDPEVRDSGPATDISPNDTNKNARSYLDLDDITLEQLGQIQCDDTTCDLISDDSDADPTFKPGKCELKCNEYVFAACVNCSVILCYDHFVDDDDCDTHGTLYRKKSCMEVEGRSASPSKRLKHGNNLDVNKNQERPEGFAVVGYPREFTPKKKRPNKAKEAHRKRSKGQEYISPFSKKVVPARKCGLACQRNRCVKQNLKCTYIHDSRR